MLKHVYPVNRLGYKAISVALMILLTLFVVACGSSEEEEFPTPTPTKPFPTPTSAEAAAEEAEAAETPEAAETTDDAGDGDAEAAEAAEEAEEIRVYFAQPSDGAIVPPNFVAVMRAEGVVVEPSGEVKEGAGHMHILVDTDFVEVGEAIVNDETHLHYGDASLEAELSLEPGTHILRLQFADGAHIALEGDQYRDEIVVTVKENAPEQSVRFVHPTDGAIVPPIFSVQMTASGLVVEPSGDVNEGAGHMHLLVDTDFVEPGEVIVNDEMHLHFGGAQLMTELTLEPGAHTLRLQMADGAHTALEGDQYRDEMVVWVQEDAADQSVRFVYPTDGAIVPETFPVQMAATGMVVEPSGLIRDAAVHMHILVNEDFTAPGDAIVNDETHLHYGGGQLETELTLEPGEHILRLQAANGAHLALEGEQYQAEITVTVIEGAASPQVMFIEPMDGDTVSSPFAVRMGATGLAIESSGRVIREEGGHLHILVNEDFVATGEVIVNDETHLHYGGGQLATELELAPGEYTLRLQMANGAHIALDGSQYQDEITITVE